MALKLDILANTRQFISEMKKGGASVEDISDELDDMARDGAKAGDKLEASFRDIAKASDKTGKEVKGNLKSGFDDAKQEAGQSGREAAASFSGGFDDVSGFVQETVANAFGGFGPIGAAAGIAVAAAIGTVLANASAAQEKLADARQAGIDLAATLYENKGKLPLENAIQNVFDILAKEIRPNGPIQSMLDGFLDLGSAVDGVKDSAKELGIPLDRMARALSGSDMKESRAVLKQVNEHLDAMKANVETAWVWQTGPFEDVKTTLETTIETARIARESLSIVGSSIDTSEYVAKVEAIGAAWTNAMTDASDYFIETEEGATTFDWSTYLTDAETTLKAANEFKRKIVSLDPSIKAEGERIFEEQGATAALQYTDAFLTASTNDKQRFISAARNNGEAAGKAAGEALAREAEAAAKAKAQGNAVIPVKFAATLDDSAIRNYVPPVKRLRIVANGQVEWN